MYTAFDGITRVAVGDLPTVAMKTKEIIDNGQKNPVLIFSDATGKVVDVDYRLEAQHLTQSLEPEVPRKPGRPRLGVVGKEVTLLPRHWEWLNQQPGGASVALRKLVDEARKTHEAKDRIRNSREAAYRFMTALAGNEPGFEEALRALFSGNRERFELMIGGWPPDVRDYANQLATPSFE